MGMMDDEAENRAYSFASSDIDDFESELRVDKQKQSISMDDDLDNVFSDMDDEAQADAPLDKIKARGSVANATGSLFASMVDAGVSTAIGTFIAKDDPANWKASETERSEMESAIADYVKLKGGDIPPGVALLIVVLSIYGPKVAYAFQYRKMEQKQSEMQAYINELESKLNKRDAENEVENE